jgi:uncharacterized LabA/DUF88 family protein
MNLILIDTHNLYHCFSKISNVKVDYKKLIDKVLVDLKDDYRIIAYGYEVGDQTNFKTMLKNKGAELRFLQPLHNMNSSSCSVQLTIDAFNFIEKGDTLSIVSSDPNLRDLIHVLSSMKGTKTTVYGTGVPTDLRLAAYRFLEINEGYEFDPK